MVSIIHKHQNISIVLVLIIYSNDHILIWWLLKISYPQLSPIHYGFQYSAMVIHNLDMTGGTMTTETSMG